MRATFAEWAGAETPGVDGRSLVPLLTENPIKTWRTGVLIEATRSDSVGRPAYDALRMRGGLYVEYASGERELYDLNEDRQQMNNLAGSTDPAVLEELSSRLAKVKDCAGEACRDAETL
jgi:hypothetical protein